MSYPARQEVLMVESGVMMRDKYAVGLAQEQREELQRLIRVGKSSARVTARARILLKSDDGWAAPQVAEALDVALSTVYRVKQRFAEEGLEGGLQDRPQANRPRKLDDRGEAHPVSSTGQALIALACSPAPEGHDHWTLRLLAGKVVELGLTPSMSPRGGAPASQKNALKPWQKKEWCIPRVSADFVAPHGGCPGPRIQYGQALYAEPYDPKRPVVCFDETSTQLLGETRPALPPRPGLPLRQDYEYRREGTRNLFLACEPLAGWREVAVTERRTMQDFAHQMRWLVDEAYPEIPVVRVVLDNLNTHRMASLYEAFPAAEARRIAQRLEFHYTPKHGSWLNMAEIEFSVLSRSCLRQRLPDEDALRRETLALVQERNAAQATINWRFNTRDARTKLHRLYPSDFTVD